MKKEFVKRFITSVILIFLLSFMIRSSVILISSLLLIFVFSWIEFNFLLEKIFTKKPFYFKYFCKLLVFIYLLFFIKIIIDEFLFYQPYISKNIIFVIVICILSDIGGYIFGKTFKGKKLTKISPNKTYSGMYGSFLLSTSFVVAYSYYYEPNNLKINILISLLISLVCQLGDLFISYLKRKSKVKDTGNILPGHGGILDRIDDILYALPFGLILINYIQ